jgi:serine/threonine protein kinase
MKTKTKSNKTKFLLKSGSPYSFNNKAGEAIAAGGFGCVFKPAIPCKGETTRSDGISKVLLKKDAKDEYKETLRIRPVINKIPNNQKYFLIQEMRICQPEKLTRDDKKKFNKCNNLIKRGITEININIKLNKLEIINLPYGGVDLSILIRKKMNDKTFATINHKLTSLITNAIVPMNKLNLIHADLKDANMLFNEKDDEIRIIDWGFGEILKKSIPRSMDSRPLQFNAPFSSILLNKDFNVVFTKVLKFIKNKPT